MTKKPCYQTCPICFGRGHIPRGFSTSSLDLEWAGDRISDPCGTCNSTGVIKVLSQRDSGSDYREPENGDGTVSIDDVIREFERVNFKHVNDPSGAWGTLTEVYCCAVVEIALRLRELDPTFKPPLTWGGRLPKPLNLWDDE